MTTGVARLVTSGAITNYRRRRDWVGPVMLLAFTAGLIVGSWAALLVREFGQ